MVEPENVSALPNRVTVIVPTYRRASCLTRCLRALLAQKRAADEILVVVREGDTETESLFGDGEFCRGEIRKIVVQQSGVIAAMNAALVEASGNIIALT